ncbi:MAG: SusC/RagA family TonB-linked outer membrane protein, partial [Gemmatimonadaceae bacterium]
GAIPAWAQGTTVSGRVRSEQGQNLQAANVFITELSISTGTNEQGAYRITIPAERVRGQTVSLRVRSIGFAPQQRQITLTSGALTQDFELKLDVNRLSEVVVTGTTGATEKAKLAFTVDAVTAQDLQVPSASALTQLQGKITGAQIVLPSGRPGENPSIILRGPKSINAQNRSQGPLIIVDGVVLTGNLADINPTDIESIEVVKGAAASSTFGSRAGSGVIQITTKSGRNAAQGVRFNARTEYGLSDVQSEYPGAQNHFMMMDEKNERFCIKIIGLPPCSRTVDFEEEARRINDQPLTWALTPHNFERDAGIGLSPPKAELRGLFQVNHWPVSYNPVAQAVTLGQFNNTNVDMVGRFGNTGFFASASNFYQEGSIRFLKGFRRNSARVNIDQQIGEEWNLQLSTLYSRGTQYRNGEFFRLTRVPAGVNLLRRDSFGRLFIRSNPLNQGSQNENPLYDNEQLQGQDDSDRYLGSLISRFIPFSWLDFEATASIDRRRISGYTLTDRGFRTTTSTGTLSNGRLVRLADINQQITFGVGGTARKSNPLGIDGLDGRIHTRLSFEREDLDTLTSAGNTLAVPGLLSLGNATVIENPSSGTGSVRALGALGGLFLDYKGRYIADAVLRYDGSSLFGSEERWNPYYRGSLAWRASEESWWFAKGAVNEFKLRASVGTAGGRPSFPAQYETFSIGAGGSVTGQSLGNKFLKPETTTETELGIDAELWSRIGVNVTYAHAITKDQILLVPPSVSSGFSNQWKNAGELENKTFEASLNVPVLTTNKVTWTSRFTYDRNRTFITELGIPPFFQTTSSAQFRFAPGERIGTLWGKYFVRNCSQLPAPFSGDCGPGKSYQMNPDGFIVWTGGKPTTEGITSNLWQSVLPGCLRAGVAVAVTGEVDCRKAGGTVNNPWAIPGTNWGMPIIFRDSTGNPVVQPLGNTQPDFRLTMSHNVQYKKFNLYMLVDGSYGNRVFNQEVHWSLGDFNVSYEDQRNRTVETAKPIGYYWRATAPDNAAGVGGLYDVLGTNNYTTQKGTYTKLREASLSYALGPVRGVGDWSVSLIGRNLWTITDFLGWDPEVGVGGTNLNSSALTAVAGFQYPQTRTFTFAIGTRF